MNLPVLIRWVWKRKLPLLFGGLLMCALLVLFLNVRAGHTYQMRVSYVYPGAEDGLYPDGQRLLREDLIYPDRVEEALAIMHQKGWYTDLTLRQVQDNLSVREFLSNPVQGKVEALRAEGKEFTYYNNEYIITFRQPVAFHLKDSKDFFGLLREDRSKEFVETLHRINLTAFLSLHTEGKVFADFSRYLGAGTGDYDQLIETYIDKATLCKNYLSKKQLDNNTFVSPTTSLSFNDLNIAYQSLIDVQISRLQNYTTALKLTRSLEERINRYKVEIENSDLHGKKKADEHDLAETAMLEYDHTFSENIIIVSVNEENGLYQARPKTAYDTVAQQALSAGVDSSIARNAAAYAEKMISDYQEGMSATAVTLRLETANQYANDLIVEFDRLAKITELTLDDYINETNRSYMKTTGVYTPSLSMGLIMKAGIGFMLGVIGAALLCVLRDSKRRAKLL